MQVAQNLLLKAIPPDSRRRLTAAARVEEVQIGRRVFNENERTQVFFPLDCVISLMRTLENGDMVEVGMVGAEGLVGLNAVLGVETNPHAAVNQGRGMVVIVPPEILREEMAREPATSEILHKYVFSFYTSVSQLAACNRRHRVEQRLAQWLLMLHDRTGADEMALTHEFLSFMLATRRAGVTEAMAVLTEAGAIESRRNRARVLDRAKLEAISCECYRISFEEYKRTMGFEPRAKGRTTPVE